jgi:hypothetical protein
MMDGWAKAHGDEQGVTVHPSRVRRISGGAYGGAAWRLRRQAAMPADRPSRAHTKSVVGGSSSGTFPR